VQLAIPGTNADGDKGSIPETTIIHLEEMLLEDQRRIVEGQDRSAGQTSRALQGRSPPASTRPRATEHSKSQKMINHLVGKLREANRTDETHTLKPKRVRRNGPTQQQPPLDTPDTVGSPPS